MIGHSKTWLLAAAGVLACASILASSTLRAGDPVSSASATPNAIATFAGGCFWCVEKDFEKVDGVIDAVSGFAGGHTKNPTYHEVGNGGTGHAEVVQVHYDPRKVSYEKLVEYFWRHVDVLDGGGQFCDRGDQYRPAIFPHTADEKRIAEDSRARLDASKRFDRPIAVEIKQIDPASFVAAEDYHQGYYKANPLKYQFYRYNCGRDQRVAKLWGKETQGAEPVAGH